MLLAEKSASSIAFHGKRGLLEQVEGNNKSRLEPVGGRMKRKGSRIRRVLLTRLAATAGASSRKLRAGCAKLLTATGGTSRARKAAVAAGLAYAACLQWPLAHGDAPPPSARALGVTESLLGYCGLRDPTAAERPRQKIRGLVQEASAQQLAEVRNSDEYRKAYVSVVEFAAKIDEHNVKKVCNETPARH
jgi:hypothetical protein